MNEFYGVAIHETVGGDRELAEERRCVKRFDHVGAKYLCPRVDDDDLLST